MVTPTGLTGLRALAAVDAAAPARSPSDAREEALARLSQIALGTEYRASVLTRLGDGQFLVRIANAAARMALPAGTREGDDIRLILVAARPRPTFLLAATPDADGRSATTSFSDAGRLIDRMLQLAQRQGRPDRVAGTTPLLNAPDAGAAPLAGRIALALRDSLGVSGLFYESHVGEWASGTRPLETLMREPQAGFRGGVPLPGGVAGAAADPGPAAPERALLTDAAVSSGASAAPQADTLLPLAPQDNPDAARLVSLQLDLLEHRRAAWQGELWPGQALQWDVAEDAPDDGKGHAGPAVAAWQSVVRFELPKLGAISATLHLQGNHVRIQVRAADGATVGLLNAESRVLADAFDAAGSPLDLLTVKQDEHA